MDYIKVYSDWAIKAAPRTGVSARWWAEHHGWKKVCRFIEEGEEAIDESFEEWTAPKLPFVSK